MQRHRNILWPGNDTWPLRKLRPGSCKDRGETALVRVVLWEEKNKPFNKLLTGVQMLERDNYFTVILHYFATESIIEHPLYLVGLGKCLHQTRCTLRSTL